MPVHAPASPSPIMMGLFERLCEGLSYMSDKPILIIKQYSCYLLISMIGDS